jgi:hypothetical protein
MSDPKHWPVTFVQRHLHYVIDRAEETCCPQLITAEHGRTVAVLLSPQYWLRVMALIKDLQTREAAASRTEKDVLH